MEQENSNGDSVTFPATNNTSETQIVHLNSSADIELKKSLEENKAQKMTVEKGSTSVIKSHAFGDPELDHSKGIINTGEDTISILQDINPLETPDSSKGIEETSGPAAVDASAAAETPSNSGVTAESASGNPGVTTESIAGNPGVTTESTVGSPGVTTESIAGNSDAVADRSDAANVSDDSRKPTGEPGKNDNSRWQSVDKTEEVYTDKEYRNRIGTEQEINAKESPECDKADIGADKLRTQDLVSGGSEVLDKSRESSKIGPSPDRDVRKPSSSPPDYVILVNEGTIAVAEDSEHGNNKDCCPADKAETSKDKDHLPPAAQQKDGNLLLSPGIFHAYPDDNDAGLLLLDKSEETEIKRKVEEEADSLCQESVAKADKDRPRSVSPDLGHELMEFGDLRRESIFPKTMTSPVINRNREIIDDSQKHDLLKPIESKGPETVSIDDDKDNTSPAIIRNKVFKNTVMRTIDTNLTLKANTDRPNKVKNSPPKRSKRKVPDNFQSVKSRRPLNRQVDNGGRLPHVIRNKTTLNSSGNVASRITSRTTVKTNTINKKPPNFDNHNQEPIAKSNKPPSRISSGASSTKSAEIKSKNRNGKLIISKMPASSSSVIRVRPSGASSKSPPASLSSKKKRAPTATDRITRKNTVSVSIKYLSLGYSFIN